jgi:hypothetical protein
MCKEEDKSEKKKKPHEKKEKRHWPDGSIANKMMTADCFRDYASASGRRDATSSPPHLLRNWRRLLSGILEGELLLICLSRHGKGRARMNETRVKDLSMDLINP